MCCWTKAISAAWLTLHAAKINLPAPALHSYCNFWSESLGGTGCGVAAADAYCKLQGHTYAFNFTQDSEPANATITLGTCSDKGAMALVCCD
jgi:hypothetical protein